MDVNETKFIFFTFFSEKSFDRTMHLLILRLS